MLASHVSRVKFHPLPVELFRYINDILVNRTSRRGRSAIQRFSLNTWSVSALHTEKQPCFPQHSLNHHQQLIKGAANGLSQVKHLSGGHGLGDKTLEGELLLLELVGRGLVELESGHGIAHGGLDLLLLATLHLEGQSLVRDNLLNTANVGLELLLSLEALAESLIVALESLGVVDHLLNLGGGELADRVADGNVGAAAGGLLSGSDLQDTVDVDLEDTLKDGLTSAHGRDGSQGEFTERGVVLAVDTLSLEHRELNCLLVVGDSSESAVKRLLANCMEVVIVALRVHGCGESLSFRGGSRK